MTLQSPQPGGLHAYHPRHRWVRLLLGPLGCGAGSHSSYKGTSFQGCQIVVDEVGIQQKMSSIAMFLISLL